ncbi:polysaccharide biosynthesis protein [Zooshikella ganghwensis]|uniref:Polysaccharide biosynthesis protein n=1 Tax=Zooshikella ganghwensis TaxID=202772 RepID=A0A4P9VLE7_9GAMM|nr:nucleoside-diphosphate sugar epimerase/dehydratase [Zooshikella ganghwensis]RDH43214.1 polysaccharide biosynthesis protein [Zooshikella ganghwensis]
MNVKHCLIRLKRRHKRFIALVLDILFVWLSLWLAFFIRLGTEQIINPLSSHHFLLFVAAPLLAIPVFIRMGLYRAVLRYMGRDAFLSIFKAVTLSSLILALAVFWAKDEVFVPRSVILNYWALSLLFIGGFRWLIRSWLGSYLHSTVVEDAKHKLQKTPVAIYGAGQAGFELLGALERGRQLQPVAFVDDDRSIANRMIGGLKVYTPKHIIQMINETGAQEILLAMPTLKRAEKKQILENLQDYPLHVRTVPSVTELAQGKVKVQDIREVEVADVLGRDVVKPDKTLLARCIRGKVVLVTGAGGSIGAELCRQIISQKPGLLILYEHSEFNLYAIHDELKRHEMAVSNQVSIVPLLGSVLDIGRLMSVLSKYQVDTVYHAAAYKHVPIVEHNPIEGFRNNVLGTTYTALAAIAGQVKHFVLISTDKAVRPTNIMGATKRAAELVLQALADEQQVVISDIIDNCQYRTPYKNQTCFTMVRFGNVLGSSGSVIPRFREQLTSGGPITVTHPEITRYFMTIPEASQLVIQAGAMGTGGEVFVLDMGEPVKINDLAVKMINLSGLSVKSDSNPEGDIEVVYTGLRPGEKLYEELLIGDENSPTDHSMIMKANEHKCNWLELTRYLKTLNKQLVEGDIPAFRDQLEKLVLGYQPGPIVDYLYQIGQEESVPAALENVG